MWHGYADERLESPVHPGVPEPHAYGNLNRHSHCDSHIHAYIHSYRYRDRYIHAYSYGACYSYANSYCGVDCNADCDADLCTADLAIGSGADSGPLCYPSGAWHG